MALTRQAAKRDANEGVIISALRAAGAQVYPISETGVPDLLVGFRGQTFLLEVKNAKGKLTEDQDQFFKTWSGGLIHVVRSVPEALQFIGAVEWGSLLDE